MYDQLGRREDLPNGLASLLGGSATYLYDRNQVIQTGASQAVNYLRMPGSGEDVIEDTRNANGGGGLYVPLLDGSGSTIAMVANATGDVASTYTYDPFGKASYGGSYITAYQYLGMENETLSGTTWAYYGGGTYYSPVLGRPLTIQGPITSAGGFGAGPGAMVGGALPGGSGDVWGSPFYSLPEGAAVPYWGSVGAVVGAEIGSYITIGEYTLGPPGAILGAILGSIFASGLFGGGGPSEPWWWIREDTRVGGQPSTWAPIYGMPAAYPPNQEKSAPSPRLELVAQHGTPRRPLAKTQKGLEPGTCQGNWIKVFQETFLGNACICYSLCVPCGGSVMWSGKPGGATSPMPGLLIGSELGSCFCKPPGPETGCPQPSQPEFHNGQ